MERDALKELIHWKNKPDRKPLIIKGARQVGKTWLIREFGKREYDQTVYINFESSKRLRSLFAQNYDTGRILTALQLESGKQIRTENTLIVFDEIQEAEGAITALKYFCEDAPQYAVIAAGSLLGVSLHQNESFPVGKVEFLNLYPLSFTEFLSAMKQGALIQLIENHDWAMIKTFREKFIHYLRIYYYTGGMPEVVQSFIRDEDFKKVRIIQNQILLAYDLDFSKHAPYEIVPRIRMLWNSIPAQLSKENRKFVYGVIKSGARSKDYEIALNWLINSGLLHKINRVSKPGIPLKAYEDVNAFKLFMADVGLLGALSEIDEKSIFSGNTIYTEFKGALTEQYVLQQLNVLNLNAYYWSADRSEGEIDFLLQSGGEIIAVEVKAEENLRAKSLKAFHQKFINTKAARISMSDFRDDEWLVNIPLYAVNQLIKL